MEHFRTLQGEGFYAGCDAYFIRLAGCDVGCVWCDVKESWEVSTEQWTDYETVLSWLDDFTGDIVVITGGEPFIYDMEPLTSKIKALGKRCHVETSGAYPLSGNWDWITLSPKKFKPALPEFYQHCNELKVVVYHKSDLAWAEEHAKQVSTKEAHFLLQPEWSKRDEMAPRIVNYIHQNPKWRISLQTHKYIGIE